MDMNAEQVLAEHQYGETSDAHCLCGHEEPLNDNTDMAAHQLEVLREAGYAIVAVPTLDPGAILNDGLPEPEWQVWVSAKNPLVVARVEPVLHPAEARDMAAALLAAAAEAEK